MALPLAVPPPVGPWQDAQYVPNAISPCAASPVVLAVYEGGFVPSRIPLRPQRENISLVIALICSSVRNPPALCANAGIDVPRIPLATTFRTTFSSTMARYTGLARAIDAPPRPSAPWQAAQFCA